MVAQAKHYAMYGAGGKDGYAPFGGGLSPRTLFETYLRPWRDFALHGGRGVMASHNLVDWVPMHANGPLLNGVLRGRFGLGQSGYVGSDNTNVEGLATYFEGFATDAADAARMAMEAGVDQDMPGGAYLSEVPKLVASGELPVATLDRAVGSILTKKFAARLFDREPDASLADQIDAEEHRALARVAAEEGSVLLSNRAAALPLDLGALQRVAVLGPFADGDGARTAMMGGYSPGQPAAGVTTVADAWRERAAQSTGGLTVDVGVGCGGGVGGPTASGEDFEHAIELAEAADAVVVVIGTAACGCCVRCGNGEVGDRMALEPEGRQLELLSAVANASAAAAARRGGSRAPVIAVLVHGRPLGFGAGLGSHGDGLPDALDGVDGLLAAWRPGEAGGEAIVRLLLGEANPSAKLAQAWQRHAGYLHSPTSPWFQPHSSMKPGKYFPNGDQTPLAPLFPFGYGLSCAQNASEPPCLYRAHFPRLRASLPRDDLCSCSRAVRVILFSTDTSFAFDGLAASADHLPASASGRALESLTLNLTLTLTNNGTRSGAVVAMATYTKLTRGVVRNMKDLAGFDKVALAPGEAKRVTLPIRLSDLARFDPAQKPPLDVAAAAQYAGGAWVVDGGAYSFFVAPCIANPALRDVHHEGDPLCSYASAIYGVQATVGKEGEVYGVYM